MFASKYIHVCYCVICYEYKLCLFGIIKAPVMHFSDFKSIHFPRLNEVACEKDKLQGLLYVYALIRACCVYMF